MQGHATHATPLAGLTCLVFDPPLLTSQSVPGLQANGMTSSSLSQQLDCLDLVPGRRISHICRVPPPQQEALQYRVQGSRFRVQNLGPGFGKAAPKTKQTWLLGFSSSHMAVQELLEQGRLLRWHGLGVG